MNRPAPLPVCPSAPPTELSHTLLWPQATETEKLDEEALDIVRESQLMLDMLDENIAGGRVPSCRKRHEDTITTGPFWIDGYDENQFSRPLDTKRGCFCDGKRFDWVPEVQLEYWSRIRHGMSDPAELRSWQQKVNSQPQPTLHASNAFAGMDFVAHVLNLAPYTCREQ